MIQQYEEGIKNFFNEKDWINQFFYTGTNVGLPECSLMSATTSLMSTKITAVIGTGPGTRANPSLSAFTLNVL